MTTFVALSVVIADEQTPSVRASHVKTKRTRALLTRCAAVLAVMAIGMVFPTLALSTGAAIGHVTIHVYRSNVDVTASPNATVAVQVLRGGGDGEPAAYGRAVTGSDGTATVRLQPAVDTGSPAGAFPMPGDRLVVRQGSHERTIPVPSLFVDIDADLDTVAGVVSPRVDEVEIVLVTAGSTQNHTRDVNASGHFAFHDSTVDFTPETWGYVQYRPDPTVSIQASFAALRLDVDIAGRTVRGRSSPGSSLSLSLLDRERVLARRDVSAGESILTGVDSQGGMMWQVSFDAPGVGLSGTRGLAGLTLRVDQPDFLVPGAGSARDFRLSALEFVPGVDDRVHISGELGAAAHLRWVTRRLFGERAVQAIDDPVDGTVSLEVQLRPGDRTVLEVERHDGLREHHALTPRQVLVVPHTASVLAFGPWQALVDLTIADEVGTDLARSRVGLRDTVGSAAFIDQGALVNVEAGRALAVRWPDGATSSVVVPAASADVQRQATSLVGQLPPGTTFDVYRRVDGANRRVGSGRADGSGVVAFALPDPPLGYGEQGALVARIDPDVSVMIGWSTLRLHVDLVDSVVSVAAPVGAELQLERQRAGAQSPDRLQLRALPPSPSAALYWLSAESLPLRSAKVTLSVDSDGLRRVEAGDRLSVSNSQERVELIVPELTAVIDPGGRLRGVASAAGQLAAVVDVRGAESLRQPLERDPADGTFAADVSALLTQPLTAGVRVDWAVPEAVVANVALEAYVDIGLTDGVVAGRGPSWATVQALLRRGGTTIAEVRTVSDGRGLFSVALESDLEPWPGAVAGDLVVVVFEHHRLPQQLVAAVPELSVAWTRGGGTVFGLARGATAAEVSVSDERSRLVTRRLPGGLEPADMAGYGVSDVDSDGRFEAPLFSGTSMSLVIRPGALVRVTAGVAPGIRFWIERREPILAMEQGGARVTVSTAEGDDVQVRVYDASGQTLAEAGERADRDGIAEARLLSGGQPYALQAGDIVVTSIQGGVITDTAAPAMGIEWDSGSVVAQLPREQVLYATNTHCIPWHASYGALKFVPRLGERTALPTSPNAGAEYFAAIITSAGNMLYRRAIAPMAVIDPQGIIRGCADPGAAVAVRLEDESDSVVAEGADTVNLDGWFSVTLRDKGQPVRVRPTDSVIVTVGDAELRLQAPDRFEAEVVAGRLGVRGEPGQTVVLFGDVGRGYEHLLETTDLSAEGDGSVSLTGEVEGRPVVRWLAAAELSDDPQHFVGTEIASGVDRPTVWLPYSRR